MILMSDTGGGHRASAEALKSAFHIKFGAWLHYRAGLRRPVCPGQGADSGMRGVRTTGDKFNVSVVDLWSNHAPWPVNQLPKSCVHPVIALYMGAHCMVFVSSATGSW